MSLTIPEAIATRDDLSLIEKVALSIIVRYPRCSNQRLAGELGFSVRGVENLLVRLRRRGLVEQVGKGSARRLRLTFEPEPHTLCGNSEGLDRRMECVVSAISEDLAVAKQRCSFEHFALRRELAANCLAAGEYNAALAHFEELRRIAERDLAGEARDRVLAILTDDETVAFGVKLINETIASQTQRILMMAALGKATPDQLGLLRERLKDTTVLGEPAITLALGT